MNHYYQDNQALGSRVYLNLVMGDDASASSMMAQLWKQIFEFERRFSRFLPGSELSLFNRDAGSKKPISPELRDILLAAQAASKWSGGLYNPLILPALQRAGYVGSMVRQHRKDYVDDYSGRSVATPERLEVGPDWARLPYGTAIDLGGIGKGYLGDQLADYVAGRVTGYWFSLGGDIAAGGLDAAGRPWEIDIQNAGRPASSAGMIRLPDGSRWAVATSGTAKGGAKQGKAWHHIIDPLTLQPAETDVRVATVIADSAQLADVLASCAIILGTVSAEAFLKSRGAKGAFLQGQNKQRRPFSMRFGRVVEAGV